jgi:ribosome biogenesis GTPase
MNSEEKHSGFVVRIKGAEYFVFDGHDEVRCYLRGKFRLDDTPAEVLPVVGDDVEFRLDRSGGEGEATGLITSLLPRRSIFARSSSYGKKRYKILGANLDFAILVFAVKEPILKLRLLDRMLVAAESGGMMPVIVINKIDLADDEEEIFSALSPYREMDYEVIVSSAVTGAGIEQLRQRMTGKRSIMVGPSGSGKTTLASVMQPGLELSTGAVSTKTGKGRHTTSHFELHPLDCGGYLGDSPGVREFGMWGVSKEDLADYFRDFSDYLGGCRFSTCTHSHEPGCSIKEAAEQGKIDGGRYDSYLRILESLPESG